MKARFCSEYLSPLRTFCLLGCTLLVTAPLDANPEKSISEGLAGHWPLVNSADDASGNGADGLATGIDFGGGHAAFDGETAVIAIPGDKVALKDGDFTIAGWFRPSQDTKRPPGDLLSYYDRASRTGINLSLQTFAGVTTSQTTKNQLFFGIDQGHQEAEWRNEGRPGNNLLVYALASHKNELYAGTFEAGEDEAGSVYRYAGHGEWIYCGSPHASNSVTALLTTGDELYAGVARYNAGGSQLEASPNREIGGYVYRYLGGTEWESLGRVSEVEFIFGMVEFDGDLYATNMNSPNPGGNLEGQGLFRYAGNQQWEFCGNPGGRLSVIAPYRGHLYAGGYDAGDKGGVFRYAGGTEWEDVGIPGNTEQTYAFMVHEGSLYTGTWPEGKVYRYAGDNDWVDAGRLGNELEVMAVSVYNGKFFAGTLPLAEVYRYDGVRTWTLTGRLDMTPDVVYRRAWSMTVHDGRLYCGVLPSGQVWSLGSGVAVSHDNALGGGWQHVAAVRSGNRLRLYVNGRIQAVSRPFNPQDYFLDHGEDLLLGLGQTEHFHGAMSDVRLYTRALGQAEIDYLVERKPQ